MALVNVRRDVSDAFYRYKMERIQTKIEGKGNGIKTVVVNLSSVAQSLARPGSYVIKYFGFELGAQTNIDPPDDRWIINGAHDSAKLQDYLDGFINKFVLCKKCKNPETDVVIKDGRILLDCKACGQRTNVDMRHKLTTFILKNPPKKSKSKSKGNTADSSTGAGPLNNVDSPKNGSDDGAEGGDSDDELTKRINKEAATLPDTNGDDAKFETDTSPEAVRARMQALEAGMKNSLIIGDDDDDDYDDDVKVTSCSQGHCFSFPYFFLRLGFEACIGSDVVLVLFPVSGVHHLGRKVGSKMATCLPLAI